ncbi:DUF4097 family beta strand repeat-containing protein [Brevibacillus dissolubilis]|uniref:DUF4097 family beta strand repeat-containing protein n=1 Tax=Brevibacillus dissolubilis TaxID=1844116 RepID=UPI001115D438|nr:DUF4097 family beta strand repeat-containing protein [Brevibacillus dissolubilis]
MLGSVTKVAVGIALIGSLSGNSKVSVNEEKRLDGREVRSVEIVTDMTSIQLTASEDENVRVHFHGDVSEEYKDKLVFTAEQVGNRLEVKAVLSDDRAGTEGTPDHAVNTRIDIALPSKMYKKFSIASQTGEIKLATNIQAGKWEMKTETGKITVDVV